MTGLRHVGIVVSDLKRAVAFYRQVFDLEPVGRQVERGDYIEQLTGIPGAELEWAKLRGQGDCLLELLQYRSHPSAPAPDGYRADRHGCSHVALTVPDIDAALRRLAAYGLPAPRPLASPDGTVRVVYARDPEGIILELVEPQTNGS